MQKLYLDTEFNETALQVPNGRAVPFIDLISVALVDDKGREYYAVSNEFDQMAARANPWIAQNVLPQLPPESEWKSRARIREDILEFVGKEEARLYYWFIPHDVVLLQQLLADNIVALPDNAAGVPFNLAQTYIEVGSPNILPPQPPDRHNALADARWARDVARVLRKSFGMH
jgi:hypothetical protein